MITPGVPLNQLEAHVLRSTPVGGNITTELQAAVSNTSNSVVAITRPGTYYLSPSVSNPYEATSKACIDIDRSNLALWIAKGVTLKMVSNSQTDANGEHYGIVFRDRSNIWIGGGGTIDMNSTSQSGWTGGYGQELGGCIRGYLQHTNPSSTGCSDITIEDLRLINTFGNPANVYGNRLVTNSETDIFFRRLRCVNFGEGLQIVGAKVCGIYECRLWDPDDVCRGDAFEISDCRNFEVHHNHLKGSGNAGDQGSCVDIYLSRDGSIVGNVFDGWNDGIGCGWQQGSERIDNVQIIGNQFLNLGVGYSAADGGRLTFIGNTWKNITGNSVIQNYGSPRDSCTITRSGSSATVTVTESGKTQHGRKVGEKVIISGAAQEEYNGVKVIASVPTSTTFTFAVSGTPTTPATGTIKVRSYRTSTVHIGDKVIGCASIAVNKDADFKFIDGEILDGTSHGITIQGAATEDQGRVEIRGNNIFDNATTGILLYSNDASVFPSTARIMDNVFSRNGTSGANHLGTQNGAVSTLVYKNRNVGITDSLSGNELLASIPDFDCLWDSEDGFYTDAGTTLANVGDPVLQWKSTVGTVRTLAAPNNGARPTRDTNGGVVSAAGDYMQLASLNLNGPFTMIIKHRTPAAFSGSLPFVTVKDGSSNTWTVGAFQANRSYFYDNRDAASIPIGVGDDVDIVVAVAVASDGTTTLWKSDGSQISGEGDVAGSPRSATADLYLFDNGTGTGYESKPVRKIMLVNRVLSKAEVNAIQGIL